jgi:hypothetical protein
MRPVNPAKSLSSCGELLQAVWDPSVDTCDRKQQAQPVRTLEPIVSFSGDHVANADHDCPREQV